jgi:hypothetical protein
MPADQNYVDNKSCVNRSSNEDNTWEGGGYSINEEDTQNMLAKQDCVDGMSREVKHAINPGVELLQALKHINNGRKGEGKNRLGNAFK